MNKRKSPASYEVEALLLTVPQAAELLNVGKDMVYSFINEGSLPAIDMAQPGHRVKLRISRAVLEDWIEERQRRQNPYHDLLMTKQPDERQSKHRKKSTKSRA